MPDDMRAAFEKWVRSMTMMPLLRNPGCRDQYENDGAQAAWIGWQAAIAWERERVAKLPPHYAGDFSVSSEAVLLRAALPKCPECGKTVDALSGMCEPCAFSQSRVPVEVVNVHTKDGPVSWIALDGGTIQPRECDDA